MEFQSTASHGGWLTVWASVSLRSLISIHILAWRMTATYSISWKLLQQMQVLAAIYGTAYRFSASTNSIFPYILVRNQGKTAACFRFAQAAFVFPLFVFLSLLYQMKPAYRSFLSLLMPYYVLSNSPSGYVSPNSLRSWQATTTDRRMKDVQRTNHRFIQ